MYLDNGHGRHVAVNVQKLLSISAQYVYYIISNLFVFIITNTA